MQKSNLDVMRKWINVSQALVDRYLWIRWEVKQDQDQDDASLTIKVKQQIMLHSKESRLNAMTMLIGRLIDFIQVVCGQIR